MSVAAVPALWLTSAEAGALFGRSGEAFRLMLEDPEHAAFAARCTTRGRQVRVPATICWFYANEARMPESREDLAAFLELFPLPDLTEHRREARLVRREEGAAAVGYCLFVLAALALVGLMVTEFVAAALPAVAG